MLKEKSIEHLATSPADGLANSYTSEAENETSKSCYRHQGWASGETAAEMFNSEALSPVSVPVTSSSDPQRTHQGVCGFFRFIALVYEKQNQRSFPVFFLTKATYGGGSSSWWGTQDSAAQHNHLSCNLLLVFHLKVPL